MNQAWTCVPTHWQYGLSLAWPTDQIARSSDRQLYSITCDRQLCTTVPRAVIGSYVPTTVSTTIPVMYQQEWLAVMYCDNVIGSYIPPPYQLNVPVPTKHIVLLLRSPPLTSPSPLSSMFNCAAGRSIIISINSIVLAWHSGSNHLFRIWSWIGSIFWYLW